MIFLYNGGGATLTQVFGLSLPEDEWIKLSKAITNLLLSRGKNEAAKIFQNYPFELLDGTNYFGDKFSVLYTKLPLEKYVEVEEVRRKISNKFVFKIIAETISEVGPFTRFIVAVLDTDERVIPVTTPAPRITSEAVERAIADAEILIKSRGATSAVDRIHTALHGFLKAMLGNSNIPFPKEATITMLFKLLKERNQRLKDLGSHSEEIEKILKAYSTIIDSLNNLRNRASSAHPNDQILDDADAMLAINAARTIIHYLDSKLGY